MKLTDLATLPHDLSQFDPEELLDYLKLRIPWLSRLNNLPIDGIVSEICNSVLDVDSEEARLGRVAELYCWLLPRKILTSWQLYGISGTAGLVLDCPTLIEHIAAALRVPGYGVRLAWNMFGGVFYAALLTEDYASWPSKNNVVCVALWCGLPLLAVHAVGASIERRFQVALDRVLISYPAVLLDGIYEDLNGAFCAGRRLLAYLCERLYGNTRHDDALRAASSEFDQVTRHEKSPYCGHDALVCCVTCDTYFTRKGLDAHQQKMPTGRKPCCMCPFDKARSCSMTQAEKSDDDLRPLDCRVGKKDCNEVTNSNGCSRSPSSTTHHENAHFGSTAKHSAAPKLEASMGTEAPMDFLCLVCGMAFARRTALDEHCKIHTRENILPAPRKCLTRRRKRARKR